MFGDCVSMCFMVRGLLVDIIDKDWRKDRLFCDDIWIQPEMEKTAQKAIDRKNPKQKQHKLWQSTGLQRLNGDQMS